MPKYDIDDDPAFALTEQTRELAKERKLDAILDKIAACEEQRVQASLEIKTLWKVIEKAGFDVPDARRRLVRRHLA